MTSRSVAPVFVFVSLAFISFCCKTHPNNPLMIETVPIDSGFIQPLTVGTEWNYQDTGFQPDGTIRNPGVDFLYHLRIKRDTMIAGKSWSQIVSLPESNDAGFREWLSNRPNGLWEGYPLEGDSLTWLRLPYPAKAGTKATGRYAEWWVVSTNITITVPAGTFRCYHYKIHDLSRWSYGLEHDYFFSPGVGLIRSNWYTIDDVTSSVYMYIQRNLTSYAKAP